MKKATAARTASDKYFSQISKDRLTQYNCPTCNANIKSFKPWDGVPYDTVSACPDCGDLHFKIVHQTGRVEVTPFDGAA